jgi:hypothetical protein
VPRMCSWRRTAVVAVVVIGFARPVVGGQQAAPPAPDIATLQASIAQLREQLDALERQVTALQAAQPGAGQPVPAEPAPAPPPAAAPVAAAEPAPAPATAPGTSSPSSKVFNPDVAVIGNFVGAAGRNAVAPLPALSLNEAEVSFQAVVDPYARADFFLAASPEGLEVEEGFLTLPTLPGGLLMKVGKLKAQFGKVNTLHAHVLPWVDEPLPMKNLLGGDEGLSDAGISVSRLIPNAVMFLEATGEVYNGDNGVFASRKRSDLTYVGRLRGYRDLTEGTNLDLGTSFAFGHNETRPDATTRLYGIDATIRYRPLRRAIYKRFLGRTELFWSRRDTVTPGDQADAFGAYVSGDYQFARRWFAGGRYDWSDRAEDPTRRDTSGSFLLTYWPSEFSQVRGQFRRTAYAEGVEANEVLVQFLFSIGAHGAHVF